MSLEPFFSMSALSPSAFTYDAANPSAPYASAYLHGYGEITGSVSSLTLADQYENDQILLAYNPVLESDQTLTTASDFTKRCTARVVFAGVNVSTLNQYLLVFRLARRLGSPIAQFFIGGSFVRNEALTQGTYDDVALLLDTPGDNILVSVCVRLAMSDTSNHPYHGFFFKGVDCYLL